MFYIEQSIEFGLSMASKRIAAVFKEEFNDYGVTMSQFLLLVSLWETDGLSQIELAKKTNIDSTTMAGIIDRLEKSEILRRSSSSEDRRARLVWLTEKGRSLKQELFRAACRVQDRVKAQIVPGEYKQLQQLLNKLLLLR